MMPTVREPLRCYRLFGLTIASEFALNDVEPGAGPPDVWIRRGSPPPRLDAPVFTGAAFQAGPNQVLVDVEGIARIYIRDGREVTVAPAPGVSAHYLSYAILKSAIGPLLHQRNRLVLHASAVRTIDGRAVAIAGRNRSGKSTVLFTAVRRGWSMITDDIAPIDISCDGARVAHGMHVVSLWRDVLDYFAVESARLTAVLSDVEKFNCPVSPDSHVRSDRLSAVVVLEPDHVDRVTCTRLQGARAFAALRANVRGLQVAEAHQRQGTFFQVAAALEHVAVFSIKRPIGELAAAERIVDLLEGIVVDPSHFTADVPDTPLTSAGKTHPVVSSAGTNDRLPSSRAAAFRSNLGTATG